MNRITINTADSSACITCGGLKMVRYDVSDFGIIGVFPCHSCQGGFAVREFLAPLSDYLPDTPVPDGVA